ncbi:MULTISPECIES: (2,3-dihydroxybenzoyl)adenylate synthase [Frankia]|uniref:(2,3-dihydroxybenzoyl)adenylate synthase (2, 3-dihydroxybenzoate-AMP ligase Dihydroxybenzoic acid-activating enzyme) n=1 Tax=Frankia alni (strain DSM 45986 / CECT 9034 / ACN14a) TaxID=326424 RepID=Q0RGU6_FRAAA|nr:MULTISPECIES: AMP-binding protein [Frankia]CAJ63290.2 (2,3-dihydroxybenzoyl)adenylate synthase (2, 3-dihydroxybenzoate-AMP ligase; Dihydroxybenzoic acid-activating enzyme) [Frankia alni ACN14a]
MLAGCIPWPDEAAERYRSRGLWRGESLGGLLRTAAERHGPAPALVHGGRRISYAQLDRWVDRLAGGFAGHGLRAGERVVVQLPNVPEFVATCFALFRLGAKPVFALTAHRSREIAYLCDITGAAAYVFPGRHRGFDHPALAREIRAGTHGLRLLFALGDAGDDLIDLSTVDGEAGRLPEQDASDVAFFLLSGGTTAIPKIIPRTHDDYAYQCRATADLIGFTAADVYLAVLPLEFNFTWGCPGVIGTLLSGGTVVLADDPTTDDCFATIERCRVTVTSLVPTLAQLWLEATEWNTRDLSSLRLVQLGGARPARSLVERIGPAFGCELQQVFGMAEGLLTLTRQGDPPETVLGTTGTPLSEEDEIRIVGEDERDLPGGEVGELLVRGPYTLRGYYRAAEHNTRAFTADGFYRTGDLARLTANGDLVIEGRIKDVVIRGGNKTSAAELEEHLLTLPGILRAAVVGLPDELLGERIGAFLVTAGTRPSRHELNQGLQQRGLAEYKFPDQVEFVDELPVTPLGKIDKKALASMTSRDRPSTAHEEGEHGDQFQGNHGPAGRAGATRDDREVDREPARGRPA